MPSGISENAWSVPFAVWLDGEVLLDHPRAEHVRDRRHRDAVLVVGEPDHELGVALAVRRDHAELELLDGGRVGRRALQQAELGVDRP